ncbi:16S rRNA (uracil1498-N3)-methyltransferase [Pilibacter termitis]|jgi:16S rRNA (uracil1498-N3)-methyltransferase|uniref:Ribosomal RNA small subunit methyltransferase E n=1 Tax=Pilibacter termitis TaxID=263852 RepID=A0A1T4PWX2_9ENTE|nr:16S rRNA (uracil(1498)-N(3))-methyltransferase [Pilibacter termitis]SJZ95721.1 16S rRNA (uracil1498-N3)-methyltransferase [Pilibacter termitis]
MQRYFLETPTPESNTLLLQDENLHHMLRVMRMKEKQEVYLVFSDEKVWQVSAKEVKNDGILFEKVCEITKNVEMPVQVSIASGFPKGDKAEWITQKAVELGVHTIFFFPSTNSVVKWDDKKREKKQIRLQKIAQEAAEQSHRTHLPKVELLANIQELYSRFVDYQEILIAYEESAKNGEDAQLLQTIGKMEKGEELLAIFGAEGGLSVEEVEKMTALGGKCAGLGPRILRTETAPMYLLGAVSVLTELKNGGCSENNEEFLKGVSMDAKKITHKSGYDG